jgi:hypothetical protein
MYIEAVPNRNAPPAILLRETYRQNGRFCKPTLCNLSARPFRPGTLPPPLHPINQTPGPSRSCQPDNAPAAIGEIRRRGHCHSDDYRATSAAVAD